MPAPLQVAVVGGGRAARQMSERLSVCSDFTVAAVVDSEGSEWEDMVLSRPNLDLIAIATPLAARAAHAIAALRSGKNVLIELPVGDTSRGVEAILAASRESGCSVSITHAGLSDSDFLSARQAVQSGALGQVRLASLCLWQRFPPVEPRLSSLWEFAPLFLEQALTFLPDPPAGSILRRVDGEDGFCLVVEFPAGVAQLQIHRSAFAPVDTGWTLTGTAGGYAQKTLYTPVEEGEIADEPVTLDEGAETAFLPDLARHLRGQGPNPGPADRQRDVLRILEECRPPAPREESRGVA